MTRSVLLRVLTSLSMLPMLLALFTTPANAAPLKGAAHSAHAEAILAGAGYNGHWSGTLKSLYDPGLWPADESDTTLKLDIQGDVISVQQTFRSKKGATSVVSYKAGDLHFQRVATNAIAEYMHAGRDAEGAWVETVSLTMTLKDSDHMIIHWTRIMNNISQPLDKPFSKFSVTGMGELTRSGATR